MNINTLLTILLFISSMFIVSCEDTSSVYVKDDTVPVGVLLTTDKVGTVLFEGDQINVIFNTRNYADQNFIVQLKLMTACGQTVCATLADFAKSSDVLSSVTLAKNTNDEAREFEIVAASALEAEVAKDKAAWEKGLLKLRNKTGLG